MPVLIRIGVIALFALASACASGPKSRFVPLDPAVPQSLVGTPVELTPGEPAPFRKVTAAQRAGMMTGMMFGFIGGGAAALSADARARKLGEDLRLASDIPDPAPELGRRVMALLQERWQIEPGDSAIQLLVTTEGWGVHGKGVASNLVIELADTASEKQLARVQCRFQSAPVKGWTLDDYEANQAAAIKQALDGAIDECVAYFESNMLR